MDFLDSIDLKQKQKKSSRVRSWYLYEQFKSLERNQLDAAQKLKERSYQDKILRQELSERRARRKLYDQFGLCHSESCLDKIASEGNKTSLSASTDDFFESFCELHEDERSPHGTERDTDTEDAYSQDDSQTGKPYLEDFKSVESIKDDQSFAGSVNSVIQNLKSTEKYTEDLKEEIKQVKKNFAEEINLQFETVKENIQCLEKYSKMCCEDKISEVDSLESFEEGCLKAVSRGSQEGDLNLYNIWSKLVSFAYQVVQLNHGNCYYDYSSQLLTAVLACDVLRRGVNRMCHILQPYVSPIKFATDDSDSSIGHKSTKRKKLTPSKKSKKSLQNKIVTKAKRLDKSPSHSKYCSDDYVRNLSRNSFEFKNKSKHRRSDPRSAAFSTCRGELSEASSCSIWPSSGTMCECPCHVKVTNPMQKIGEYIDRILKDIDECTRV